MKIFFKQVNIQTLNNRLSILRAEDYMLRHGLLKTGYSYECFKINFTSSMTAVMYYIWFIICVITVSNSLPGKNPTVCSVVQKEIENNSCL